MNDVSTPLRRAVALLFLPIRRLLGPIHRRRPALTESQEEEQKRLPPLPAPWSDDPRWYPVDFPPRAHNHIVPLPHGQEYFRDLVEQLRSAHERVTICGWCLSPHMPLLRGREEKGSTVVDLLRETSERVPVYVLLWSGAPALFQPSVKEVEEVRRALLSAAPGLRCELDRRASFSHDHHQKAVTIDGRVAYVGGIDLSTFQGDRWDTPEHVLRFGQNWHDVQMRLQGEIVADVETNFCQRWEAVTGESVQPLRAQVEESLSTPAQIVRTIPTGFYPFAPSGHFGIRHALLAAIERAERFIYLENQYIWAPEVVQALVDAMNRPRSRPFRITMVLPARAYSGRYDNDEHVQALREADRGRGIFEAYSLYTTAPAMGLSGYRAQPIYVHAKVSIVDDEWLSVGSANLNRRGLATDTEMNVQAVAPDVARRLRIGLWAEHLGLTDEEIERGDAIELLDTTWKEVARGVEATVRNPTQRPPRGQVCRYEEGKGMTSHVLDVLQGAMLEH